MIRFLWTLALSLTLQAQQSSFSTHVTVDENGHWVLRVELATNGFFGPSYRWYRFLLDTGSTLCVLDKSIATDFFKPHSQSPMKVTDINGATTTYSLVSIHRMRVGEITQQHVNAIVMDLKHGLFGSIEDEPIDGIIGMNFLKGRSFTWEPLTQAILWNVTPLLGRQLSIVYGETNLPTLNLSVDKSVFQADLDTGAATGLSVPAEFIKTDQKGTEVRSHGLNGSLVVETEVNLPTIEAGPYKWEKVSRVSLTTGHTGNLGLSVFAHLKTGFDFTKHLFILPEGPDHSLLPPFQECSLLPIQWVRKGSESHLEVMELTSGGSYYKAGLRQGDVLRRVNDSEGPRLKRRAIQEAVRSGPTTWVVLRNKEPLTLRLEAQLCPPLPEKP